MKQAGLAMRKRGALAEHPFGTLKDRAEYSYRFLVRTLKKVQGERSLISFAYNFTRVLNIIGMKQFIAHCEQVA